MPTDIVIRVVGAALIWLFFLLVVVFLLLSQAKEFGHGRPMRWVMPFAAGILGLCAIIMWAMISARVHKGIEVQLRISRVSLPERGV